jgi:hypothetical protein
LGNDLLPIRPFLAGQPFEPDTIRSMSSALESVCETLRLKMIDDAATRLVAQKIIELAQRGVHHANTLTKLTLQEFKYDDAVDGQRTYGSRTRCLDRLLSQCLPAARRIVLTLSVLVLEMERQF